MLRRSWGVVNRYCIWEGSSEVIIEYWRGREAAVKLIYADNPAEALMHFYYAEQRGGA